MSILQDEEYCLYNLDVFGVEGFLYENDEIVLGEELLEESKGYMFEGELRGSQVVFQ